MTFQISVKDVQKAIQSMKSNVAVVVCSENPRMSCAVQVLCDNQGFITTSLSYQVANTCVSLDANATVKQLVNEFNDKMREYADRQY